MSKMLVKVISDTHNDHQMCTDLECDILVHCGDFSTKGNYTEVKSFLNWFVKQPAKYKIVVPGNHDRKIKSHSELQALTQEYGIHLLMNDSLEINGRKIWGGIFVPRFKDGKCISPLHTRASAWAAMPMELDLLITHAPPRYILDTNLEGENIGCDQLLKSIKIRDIKYHVFGHIHEHGGETVDAFGTKFINAACKDRQYLFVRNYQKFSI